MRRSKRHYRLTLGDALSAHEKALAFGGGSPGIHDLTLIQSAIARPYSGYHRHITLKAAALVQSVAMNHGFLDGNKRTALILLDLFLDRSGYTINPPRGEGLNTATEEMILAAVQHQLDFDGLVRWFEGRLRRQ